MKREVLDHEHNFEAIALWKHKGKEEGYECKDAKQGSQENKGPREHMWWQSKQIRVICQPSWRLRTLPLPCYFCIHLVSGWIKKKRIGCYWLVQNMYKYAIANLPLPSTFHHLSSSFVLKKTGCNLIWKSYHHKGKNIWHYI